MLQNQLIQYIHTAKQKYYQKIVRATDQHQILLVTVKDDTKREKKYHAYLLFFITTSMS